MSYKCFYYCLKDLALWMKFSIGLKTVAIRTLLFNQYQCPNTNLIPCAIQTMLQTRFSRSPNENWKNKQTRYFGTHLLNIFAEKNVSFIFWLKLVCSYKNMRKLVIFWLKLVCSYKNVSTLIQEKLKK